MYQHILIATDGSELARKGLEHGLALARPLIRSYREKTGGIPRSGLVDLVGIAISGAIDLRG